jgi:hypothetical protein
MFSRPPLPTGACRVDNQLTRLACRLASKPRQALADTTTTLLIFPQSPPKVAMTYHSRNTTSPQLAGMRSPPIPVSRPRTTTSPTRWPPPLAAVIPFSLTTVKGWSSHRPLIVPLCRRRAKQSEPPMNASHTVSTLPRPPSYSLFDHIL